MLLIAYPVGDNVRGAVGEAAACGNNSLLIILNLREPGSHILPCLRLDTEEHPLVLRQEDFPQWLESAPW